MRPLTLLIVTTAVIVGIIWSTATPQPPSLESRLLALRVYSHTGVNSPTTEPCIVVIHSFPTLQTKTGTIDWGHGGFSGLSVDVQAPRLRELRQEILTAINSSPKQAHHFIASDRPEIQYATFDTINCEITRNSLQPHVYKELAHLVANSHDPGIKGYALQVLALARWWDKEAFDAAINSPHDVFRVGAIYYFNKRDDFKNPTDFQPDFLPSAHKVASLLADPHPAVRTFATNSLDSIARQKDPTSKHLEDLGWRSMKTLQENTSNQDALSLTTEWNTWLDTLNEKPTN